MTQLISRVDSYLENSLIEEKDFGQSSNQRCIRCTRSKIKKIWLKLYTNLLNSITISETNQNLIQEYQWKLEKKLSINKKPKYY